MTNVELSKLVESQNEQINTLRRRMSDVTDDLTLLRQDLKVLKLGVGEDIKRLVETIQHKG